MKGIHTTRARAAWDAYRRAEAAHVARIEDSPAEPKHLPRWGALLVAPAALGVLAWLAVGLAQPGSLAELARSGPMIGALLACLIGCAAFALDAIPVLEPRRRVEVLYHREPSWLPGETQALRDARLASGSAADPAACYPDLYPGQVISVRDVAEVASGERPSLRNMASRDWPCLTLDLYESEIAGLTSRVSKIDRQRVVPLTIEDRHGATLAPLVARYGSRAAVEAAEFAADFERREAQLDPSIPHEESSFEVEVSRLRSALPPTITHTGTGLYCVKVTPTHLDRTQSGAPVGQAINLTVGGLGVLDAWKGGYVTNATRAESRAIVSHVDAQVVLEGVLTNWLDTDDLDIYDAWSTVQSALDQLWTDQGSAAFTLSQYVRIFAGTYAENVVPNAGIRPAKNYALVIEGDPDDSRANVHLAPSAGTYAYWWSPSTAQANHVIRHLTFDGTPTTAHVRAGTNLRIVVRDCAFDTAVKGVYGYCLAEVEDSAFVATSGNAVFILAQYGSPTARRCSFEAQDTANWTGVFCDASGVPVVEGCTFSTMKTGVSQADGGRIAQNTFYNCATGVQTGVGLRTTLVDNIFSGCTTNINMVWGWPQITATAVGPPVTLRYNCFHGYTNFAYDGTDAKTFAQFAALNLCDAAGDLDGVDPLMTDPAAGDFSLGPTSRCNGGAPCAGVYYDVDGDPYYLPWVAIGAKRGYRVRAVP